MIALGFSTYRSPYHSSYSTLIADLAKVAENSLEGLAEGLAKNASTVNNKAATVSSYTSTLVPTPALTSTSILTIKLFK